MKTIAEQIEELRRLRAELKGVETWQFEDEDEYFIYTTSKLHPGRLLVAGYGFARFIVELRNSMESLLRECESLKLAANQVQSKSKCPYCNESLGETK